MYWIPGVAGSLALGALELELQVLVSHRMPVLGTELGSPERATDVFLPLSHLSSLKHVVLNMFSYLHLQAFCEPLVYLC